MGWVVTVVVAAIAAVGSMIVALINRRTGHEANDLQKARDDIDGLRSAVTGFSQLAAAQSTKIDAQDREMAELRARIQAAETRADQLEAKLDEQERKATRDRAADRRYIEILVDHINQRKGPPPPQRPDES